MHSLSSCNRRNHAIRYYLICMLGIMGLSLSWSNYLISASTVMLSFSLLFPSSPNGESRHHGYSWSAIRQRVSNQLLPLACCLFYLLTMVSGFWSETLPDFWRFGRIMLPMLVLPLVFIGHGHLLKSRDMHIILAVSVFAAFITSTGVLVNYYLHMDDYNHQLLKGKSIKTPVSHVRYSIVMACSAIASFFLSFTNIFSNRKYSKAVFGFLAFYFFAAVHILSVKTGVLGLYGGIMMGLLVYAILYKRFVYFFLGCFALAAGLILAIKFIPSVQKKYYYSIWQIGEWSRGKAYHYSDIERWVSMKMAWQLILENPLLGTGLGDASAETKRIYEHREPTLSPILPHNQFLFTWAFSGLAAFLALCCLSWLGLFSHPIRRRPAAMATMTVIFSSLLFEATLTSNLGVGIFLFYLLMTHRLSLVDGRHAECVMGRDGHDTPP